MSKAGRKVGAAVVSAAFLDRDGTIIRDAGYLATARGVELLPGAAEAIRLLNGAGVPVVIVTNQSGIGRGFYTEAEFGAVQSELDRQLAGAGARVDAVFHCPHAPEQRCPCRKPGSGMYREAAARLGVDLERALYAGDRASDVEPAVLLGGVGLLVAGPDGTYDDRAPSSCVRAPDLFTGVHRILEGSPTWNTEEG